MTVRRIVMLGVVFGALALGPFAGAAQAQVPEASNASCSAQFTAGVAPFAVPFGVNVVVPEVEDLTLGGPNLGQEVKVFFATADRDACPVTP